MRITDKIKITIPKVGNTTFIAIDGHGGSGKSTLSNILSKKLNAEVIHIDDFSGWSKKDDWYLSIIENVFNPIIASATTLNYSKAKWGASDNPEPVRNQPVTRYMILEGVTALREEFRPYLSFSIYVDTPVQICLQRGFDRDKGLDGKPDKEILKMWQEWYEKEEIYMKRDNPKQYADIVLSGANPFDAQLF